MILLTAIMVVVNGCLQEVPENFVLIKGGNFVNKKSNLNKRNATISDFYFGKYEVTQKEWIEVMGNNPSEFKGDNLPFLPHLNEGVV